MYANDAYASAEERYWRSPHHSSRQPRPHYKAMNFEKYAAEGNHFLKEVAHELGVDRNRAARITRSVLHAVRDRLPRIDAVQFGQGLPMALKGVYFDQYDLSRAPVVIRHAQDFIDYIRYKDGKSAIHDFPGRRAVEEGIAAVFRVLERTMDYGQVEQIKRMVNDELAYLFY